jgi:flagellar motor switch/type III secretory pathway protein FliN
VIAALTFGPPQLAGARALRRIAFAPRSTLPLSAACLVANGVRETLSRLLAAELEVDLIEPAMPGPSERRVLLEGATIVRVRGRLCDGFIILRPADAQRLAALAFGEDERSERAPLSDIESTTLDRIASALVPLCNTLCGTLGPVTRELAERAACDLTTYFEVRTTGSVRVALGFGLDRDPAEEIGERITLDDLADVELEGSVEFARGTLGVPAFSRLACGVTLALDTLLGGPGTLRFGDVRFARGDCGVVSGRNAFCCESDRERGAA